MEATNVKDSVCMWMIINGIVINNNTNIYIYIINIKYCIKS